MANLKSYSCPTCGSVLEVDRDQDVFDCPFCGSHFDAVVFHGAEIQRDAGELMRRKEFSKAREKYGFLLSKKPDEFEFLYNYACAVAEVDSLEHFEASKRISAKLTNLLRNDPRYRSGTAAAYFNKLLEMSDISKQISDNSNTIDQLTVKALTGIAKITKEQQFDGRALGIYALIHYGVGAAFFISGGSTFLSESPFALLRLLLYIGFPLVLFVVLLAIHSMRQGKKAEEYQARLEPYNDMKKRAAALVDENARLEKDFDSAQKELGKLKPESGNVSFAPAFSRDPKKSDVTADPKRAVICKKCGAELTLDKERKLYICGHCGMKYDYSNFIGDELTKAMTHLKNREFDSADKWFSKILAEDPGDFDANRGRILCAGKWIGFIELKLSDKLSQVDWPSVTKALDAALDNTNGADRGYFLELMVLIYNVKDYCDTCEKIEGCTDKKELQELIQRRDKITEDYRNYYRSFVDYDKKHRVAIAKENENGLSAQFSYRLKILAGSLWVSIDGADPDVPFSPGRKTFVLNLIEEAKAASLYEYKDYFELWGRVIEQFDEYSAFRKEIRQLKDREVELEQEDNTDELNELRETLKKYYRDDTVRKEAFDELYNELKDMDGKLFVL